MTALRELLAVFGIEVDPEGNLKKGDKEVEGFAEKLKKVATTVGEVFAAKELFEFIKTQVEVNSHLQEMSNRLGVSAGDIRNFGFLAKDAGLDLDSAGNSLGLLEKKLGEASSKGGESAAAFAKLGIALKEPDGKARDLTDVLGDVAQGLEDLPDQNARAAASMELFGRAGRSLIPVFAGGREAFRAAMEEAASLGNGLGDQFYKDVKDAADGFDHFGHVLQSIKDRALAAVLPAVKWVGEALKTIGVAALELDKHTHILQAAFVALSVIVGALLVDALITATAAVWALVAPMIAAFGAPVALVAALVWVVQDLVALMHGGHSVLGDFITRMHGVGATKKLTRQLEEAWKATKKAILDVTWAVGYFVGVFVGLGKLIAGGDFGKAAVDTFEGTILVILAATRALLGFVQVILAIPEALGNLDFAPIGKAIDQTGDAIFGKGGILGDAGAGQASTKLSDYGVDVEAIGKPRRDPVSQHREAGPGDVVPTAPHVGGSTVNLPPAPNVTHSPSIQQNNTNQIVVHTASDQPREVGAAVGAGVATSTQKDLDAALMSVSQP